MCHWWVCVCCLVGCCVSLVGWCRLFGVFLSLVGWYELCRLLMCCLVDCCVSLVGWCGLLCRLFDVLFGVLMWISVGCWVGC